MPTFCHALTISIAVIGAGRIGTMRARLAAQHPKVSVNRAFLGSSDPVDWAGGEFWGPLANETRNWLDHVANGKACALTHPQEARSNLEVTLAIEQAVATGETVRLAR